MQVYRGESVSAGIAIGRIRLYRKKPRRISEEKVRDADAELTRYREARQKALAQLEELYQKVRKEIGGEAAAIFESHRMILEDSDYNEAVEKTVRDGLMNAEYAVSAAGEAIAGRFAAMEDNYVRARAADVKDVSERLLGLLQGTSDSPEDAGEPVILAAEDLTPSETVRTDRKKVSALVTVQGSGYSHTAILARTMGIPVIVGMQTPWKEEIDGKTGIVDGGEGLFYVEPEEELLARFRAQREEALTRERQLQELRGKDNITRDGRRMALYANVGSIADVEDAVRNDAGGIGLFRSEFLYLGRNGFPTEEEQFAVYRAAAEAMETGEVIIRTLDLGADKKCDYLNLKQEENPALGCRGIRLCLARPEIFKTQLRALLRASVFGNIGIMYPMITGLEEIGQIRAVLEEVKAGLAAEGIPYGLPKQGIMIETPAAVMMSRELAKEVDFFSIGTNDLTQYTLAADRQSAGSRSAYDPRHPAVLRLIRMTVENAHAAGIRVAICGELGADGEMTAEFLAMGVDELSVPPSRILPLRQIIRKTDVREYLCAKEEKQYSRH
ncbi:MAG: phosphoenolpyruvate--protein phosphotransferase [bacterium]|nr:phosphoenolpyruvate--protein phosphotransferase [bacterium]